MMYKITNYTKKQAKKYGVVVKPSKNKTKKIDVFKSSKKIASVGAMGYMDFPTYALTKGQTFANKRRRLYKIRHKKDRTIKNTPGYWADRLLW